MYTKVESENPKEIENFGEINLSGRMCTGLKCHRIGSACALLEPIGSVKRLRIS
jgi:hypothetical protein